MVLFESKMCRRKAERERYVKTFQGAHHPIEPCNRIRSERIGPAQPCSKIANPMVPHPARSAVEPMILKVKPLANAQFGCVIGELQVVSL